MRILHDPRTNPVRIIRDKRISQKTNFSFLRNQDDSHISKRDLVINNRIITFISALTCHAEHHPSVSPALSCQLGLAIACIFLPLSLRLLMIMHVRPRLGRRCPASTSLLSQQEPGAPRAPKEEQEPQSRTRLLVLQCPSSARSSGFIQLISLV